MYCVYWKTLYKDGWMLKTERSIKDDLIMHDWGVKQLCLGWIVVCYVLILSLTEQCLTVGLVGLISCIREIHVSCLMESSATFLDQNTWLIACSGSGGCARERERCWCVCKSSQQFCLIEMDRMGFSPQFLLPIKRLSCSPVALTLYCIGLKRAGWLSCSHCSWQTEVVLGSDGKTGD